MLNRGLDRAICALRHVDLDDHSKRNRFLLENLIRTVEYINDVKNEQVQLYREFKNMKKEIKEKNIQIKSLKKYRSAYPVGIPEGFFEEPNSELS